MTKPPRSHGRSEMKCYLIFNDDNKARMMGVISARAHTAHGIQGPVISAVCENRSKPHVRDPNIGIFVVVTMGIGSSVNRVISPPLPPPSLSVPKHPNTRIIPSSAHINWLGSREQVKS